jgi:hypothetical protein
VEVVPNRVADETRTDPAIRDTEASTAVSNITIPGCRSRNRAISSQLCMLSIYSSIAAPPRWIARSSLMGWHSGRNVAYHSGALSRRELMAVATEETSRTRRKPFLTLFAAAAAFVAAGAPDAEARDDDDYRRRRRRRRRGRR